MTANNPLLRSPSLRRRLFVSYPDDLTPSRLAKAMAHAGTFLEFAAPLTLLFVTGPGPLLVVGMVFVLLLHGFILSNLPAGAVFEWNVLSVYAAFFLFVGHPEVSLLDVGSLAARALPRGRADRACRSSATSCRRRSPSWSRCATTPGNWAWNAWLFRGDSYRKLDRLKRASPLFQEQLERFSPPRRRSRSAAGSRSARCTCRDGCSACCCRRRSTGRAFEEYRYVDGENVAGSVIGWNFGEGHLGDERLLACVQEQCGFEDGELRAIWSSRSRSSARRSTGASWTRSAACSRRARCRCPSSPGGSPGTTARPEPSRRSGQQDP